jgi:hypothetical protein
LTPFFLNANNEPKHPNDEASSACRIEARSQSPFGVGGDDISARKTRWDGGPINADWHAQLPSSASIHMGTIGGLQKIYAEKTQCLCGLKSRPPIMLHHGGVGGQVGAHGRIFIQTDRHAAGSEWLCLNLAFPSFDIASASP